MHFIVLAKPNHKTQSDWKSSQTKLVRLGENVTLMSPFENFDKFQWYKNSVAFNNQAINVQIHNVSRANQGH